MDQMLEFVGHENRYQYTIIILASLMSITMSMILYASSFILVDPNFNCYDLEKNIVACSETEFCERYYNKITEKQHLIDTTP